MKARNIVAGPSLKSWPWLHDEAEPLKGGYWGAGGLSGAPSQKTKRVSDMVSASSIILAWHEIARKWRGLAILSVSAWLSLCFSLRRNLGPGSNAGTFSYTALKHFLQQSVDRGTEGLNQRREALGNLGSPSRLPLSLAR